MLHQSLQKTRKLDITKNTTEIHLSGIQNTADYRVVGLGGCSSLNTPSMLAGPVKVSISSA